MENKKLDISPDVAGIFNNINLGFFAGYDEDGHIMVSSEISIVETDTDKNGKEFPKRVVHDFFISRDLREEGKTCFHIRLVELIGLTVKTAGWEGKPETKTVEVPREGIWARIKKGENKWMCTSCQNIIKTEDATKNPVEEGDAFCKYCGAKITQVWD